MPDYDLKGMQASAMYQLPVTIGTISLKGSIEELRGQLRLLSDRFLCLAAASLLADMKVDFFFTNLCRCAENWRRYLIVSRDHYKMPAPLSYDSPLYAAIVSGDEKLLASINSNLPDTYSEGEEYEENFIKCKLLSALSVNGVSADEQVNELLAKLEDIESEPVYSFMFKSLLGMDELEESDFWASFEGLLYVYDEWVEKKIASATTNISEFIAHRYIWFEGLAWLKLALSKKFVLPSAGLKYCPDEALTFKKSNYQGDWILIPLPGE